MIYQILIKKASGLPPMDIGMFKSGKADPFCEVYLSNDVERVFRTKTCEKTLEPTWNETFNFTASSQENDLKLHFTVYDYDKYTGNDFIGQSTLSMKELVIDSVSKFQIKLKNSEGKEDKNRGVVEIEIKISKQKG